LTIKNFVAEAPELSMHMKVGFAERLEAKEVNHRLGLVVGGMRSWVKHWIRVLEVGEARKIHGHYVTRLYPYAAEWGLDCSMQMIELNRVGFELERCRVEWVRDAEWVSQYLTKTWRNGDSRLVEGRAFQCSPGVKRFHCACHNEAWLLGKACFLKLRGYRDSKEARAALGQLWAWVNRLYIYELGWEALAAKKL
jgi:hypothetical protein